MPIYEYRCQSCRRGFSLLIRSFSTQPSVVCPRCGGSDVRRLISSFAVVRSEEGRADHLADMAEDMGSVDENDPRSMARWARRMSQEMGEEARPEFNELVDRLDAGESPESIEQSLGGGGGEGRTLAEAEA